MSLEPRPKTEAIVVGSITDVDATIIHDAMDPENSHDLNDMRVREMLASLAVYYTEDYPEDEKATLRVAAVVDNLSEPNASKYMVVDPADFGTLLTTHEQWSRYGLPEPNLSLHSNAQSNNEQVINTEITITGEQLNDVLEQIDNFKSSFEKYLKNPGEPEPGVSIAAQLRKYVPKPGQNGDNRMALALVSTAAMGAARNLTDFNKAAEVFKKQNILAQRDAESYRILVDHIKELWRANTDANDLHNDLLHEVENGIQGTLQYVQQDSVQPNLEPLLWAYGAGVVLDHGQRYSEYTANLYKSLKNRTIGSLS